MRILWTLAKVVIGLAIAIPVALIALIVLGAAIGVLGAMVGLAVLALKLAVILLVAVGCVRLVRRLFRGPAPARPVAGALPAADPYYRAAMQELDLEFSESTDR